ncbi:MAG: hypothetical protein JNL11_14440 [Bdellovibrionaceae bacterium]|nr:hypothetical protein [Pseudobdellovibrionaceae bacterium]
MKYLISIILVLAVFNSFAQTEKEETSTPAPESATAKGGIKIEDIKRTATPGQGGVPKSKPRTEPQGTLDDCITRDAKGRCLQSTQGRATSHAENFTPANAPAVPPTTPAGSTDGGNAERKPKER